jgi:hypothetical protein
MERLNRDLRRAAEVEQMSDVVKVYGCHVHEEKSLNYSFRPALQRQFNWHLLFSKGTPFWNSFGSVCQSNIFNGLPAADPKAF